MSPQTVGVGNNEYPFPMVRGAKRGSGEHFPFRIIPDADQLTQDDFNASGEQPADIFDDDVSRADFLDDSRIFPLKAASCSFPDT